MNREVEVFLWVPLFLIETPLIKFELNFIMYIKTCPIYGQGTVLICYSENRMLLLYIRFFDSSVIARHNCAKLLEFLCEALFKWNVNLQYFKLFLVTLLLNGDVENSEIQGGSNQTKLSIRHLKNCYICWLHPCVKKNNKNYILFVFWGRNKNQAIFF